MLESIERVVTVILVAGIAALFGVCVAILGGAY